MAFASLKIRKADKREFDRLLHETALATGSDVSQYELFHKILSFALESKSRFLGHDPRRARKNWTKYQFDLGGPTDAATEVDRTVYGLDQ